MADAKISSMELKSNLSLQKEEIEALSAIYGEDFLLEEDYEEYWLCDGDNDVSEYDTTTKGLFVPTFSIAIRPDNGETESEMLKDCPSSKSHLEARLIISFQLGYPTSSPPIYQLAVPWIRGDQKQHIADGLEDAYLDHLGESIVYVWVEKLRELLHEQIILKTSAAHHDELVNKTCRSSSSNSVNGPSFPTDSIGHLSNSLSLNLAVDESLYKQEDSSGLFDGEVYNKFRKDIQVESNAHEEDVGVHTGATLTDRKSTFQAHVAPVKEVVQIRAVLDKLYTNKKIASATHNMYAYRILKSDSKTWIQDCDDDGETHAGSRLLHLLQILNCKNVVVIVSRWYGGIQLHGDRFKHINNVARQALAEFGFISPTDDKKTDESKTKRQLGPTKR